MKMIWAKIVTFLRNLFFALYNLISEDAFPEIEDKAPKTDEAGQPIYLRPDELSPGDVLLSYGHPKRGGLSWWVRYLDGGGFSHSGYFDGTHVVEASLPIVKRTPVSEAVKRNYYTDVFRFRSDDGFHLGDNGWPVESLTELARSFINLKYATDDLIFAAVLVMTRRVTLPNRRMAAMFRILLSRAMKALQKIVTESADQVHLTCSELVYRVFHESPPAKKYRLKIAGATIESYLTTALGEGRDEDEIIIDGPLLKSIGISPLTSAADDLRSGAEDPEVVEIRNLMVEFNQLYRESKMTDSLNLDAGDLNLARRYGIAASVDGTRIGGWEPVADYISPKDLENSDNLIELGRLRKTDF